METVTAHVSSANGALVNGGIVTFQVNGQTIVAPVVNGTATVTLATGLLDPAVLIDLFFAHPLTASFTDNGGSFGSSSTVDTLPPILLDFFLYKLALQLAPLNQFQQI